MIQPDRRSAFRRIQLREPDFWPDGQSLFPSDNSNAHWVIFLYALLELYEAMMIVFFFFPIDCFSWVHEPAGEPVLGAGRGENRAGGWQHLQVLCIQI